MKTNGIRPFIKYCMKKVLIFLFVCLFLSCSTSDYIKQYNLPNNTAMYFVPSSTWTGKNITAEIDFNYKSNIEAETICNISILQKNSLPGGISSIILNANTVDYSLHNIKILTVNSRSNMVRITSTLKNNDFLEIIKATEIFLEINMEGKKYRCMPQKDFFVLQEEFQNSYLRMENILEL